MKVQIFGPGLTDQSKGDFHVHAEGCGDCKYYGPRALRPPREVRRGARVGMEVEKVTEIITAIYDPGDFGYDPETELAEYESGIWIAPCVKGGS